MHTYDTYILSLSRSLALARAPLLALSLDAMYKETKTLKLMQTR